MWLKINYQQKESEYEIFKPNTIAVKIIENKIAPVQIDDKSIRLSKIFPLVVDSKKKIDLSNCLICFFEFNNPFQILGKINQRATDQLKESIYFSYGSCSIILFSEKKALIDEWNSLNIGRYHSCEKWIVKDELISEIKIDAAKLMENNFPKIIDYGVLPNYLHSIIDEFSISIKILENKIAQHDIYNFSILTSLVSTVNTLVEELIFLNTLKGEIPNFLHNRDRAQLEDPLENQILQYQNVDRLIQINSAISYVSTQAYSGSIPILDRRSLIRRSSLLGIGASIKALNRIVDYIEDAFLSVNFLEIITNSMQKANKLDGVKIANHEIKNWKLNNIDTFNKYISNREENIKKLAYFSARHAYRESEYSITASVNSISLGITLEWTLMTLSHEMLHSHVRKIFDSIFYSEEKTGEENYKSYYNIYKQKIEFNIESNYSLIDSIREIIFTYCIRSIAYGSLTEKKDYKLDYKKTGAAIFLPKFEDFYSTFQKENRNLNEIFVHVLDLHYFYGGRTSKYIPLIWCSWSAVPHINADIRQYILRSLLAIASKIDQDPYERWKIALGEFKTIIANNYAKTSNIPLFKKLLEVLDDKELLRKYYFAPFKNSLIIVDLIMEIFYSEQVRAILWSDENINIENSETTTENEFTYNLPNDFIDVPIRCPIPYLFDRMIKVLNNNENDEEIERQTTISILALNSN